MSRNCQRRCECNKCKPHKCVSIKDKFEVTNLVSNIPDVGLVTDANAINSWGIVRINNNLYVANNGTSTITEYSLHGTPIPPVISVTGEDPTGLVYNNTNGFIVTSLPALLITATENGTIDAYNSENPTNTVIKFTASDSAVYKGLAITKTNLYAADFHNNKIDVFDSSFNLLTGFPFSDPSLPAGYAPFNIAYIRGVLFVSYAKQDADQHDDIAGNGNGFINIFNTSGALLDRFVTKDYLNSPWSMISYTLSEKCNKNVILVGNFGDGTISAYDFNGCFLGKLQDANCVDIIISGLWGLANGKCSTIYFASGPSNEENGVIGKLSWI